MTSPIPWEVLSVTFDFGPPAFCINHPFYISTDVERAFLPWGGQRAQEWGTIGCTWVHPLLPAVAHSRGWAELWLGCPGLLGKAWLELPSYCGFTSVELKCLSLMRAGWLGVQCEYFLVCAILPKLAELLRICALHRCHKGQFCSCVALITRTSLSTTAVYDIASSVVISFLLHLKMLFVFYHV